MLGDLEQRFNSLEDGSRNMVEQVNSDYNPKNCASSDLYVVQAKRLAAQQAAKGWFGF